MKSREDAIHLHNHLIALAHNVPARLGGGRPKPFAFAIVGLLAALGRRTAQIPGVNFSRFVTQCPWRSTYLSKLPA